MSETTKNTVCSICGAEISAEDGVCGVCGATTAADKSIADKADTDISAQASAQAEEAITEEEPISEPLPQSIPVDNFSLLGNVSVSELGPTVSERVFTIFSHGLINRICVLAMAVIMIAMLFLPFAHYKVMAADGFVKEIGFSAYDSIELVARSLMNLSEEELLASEFYTEFLAMQALGIPEQDMLREMIMLNAMRDGVSVRSTAIVAAGISFAYAVLCIVTVALAIKALVNEILKRKHQDLTPRKYAADSLFCFISCMLPAVMLCHWQMCDFGTNSKYLGTYAGCGVGFSVGAKVSAVLAVIGTVFICIVNFSRVSGIYKNYLRSRIKSIVCFALVLLLMISVFLPTLTVNIWNESGSEGTLYYGISNVSELPLNDKISYRSIARNNYGIIAEYVNSAFLDTTDTEELGEVILNTLLFERSNPSMFFGAVMTVSVITLICIGFLLWSVMRRCFFGVARVRMINVFKIFTVIGALVTVAMNYILLGEANGCLRGDIYYMVEFSMGIGSIIMLLCVIVLPFVRLRAKRQDKNRYIDSKYDNADVSYAPYVIDKK